MVLDSENTIGNNSNLKNKINANNNLEYYNKKVSLRAKSDGVSEGYFEELTGLIHQRIVYQDDSGNFL